MIKKTNTQEFYETVGNSTMENKNRDLRHLLLYISVIAFGLLLVIDFLGIN